MDGSSTCRIDLTEEEEEEADDSGDDVCHASDTVI